MNIAAYIKECERVQRESETEEQRRQRRQRIRVAKPQGRRHTYVREVLPSGCVLYEMSVHNKLQ
jgi:hypothetical protein